jgi:hypothetical protein
MAVGTTLQEHNGNGTPRIAARATGPMPPPESRPRTTENGRKTFISPAAVKPAIMNTAESFKMSHADARAIANDSMD